MLAHAGEVSTLAGTGKAGFADGEGSKAQFNGPNGVVCVGNTVYVADHGNHLIRAINLETKTVGTLTFEFQGPHGLVHLNGVLYVSDAGSHCIRALNLAKGAAELVGSR